MAIKRLTIANYDNLENKPIEIADLDAITPVANTYYKHKGASGASAYTDGVIYFYNGEVFKPITGGGDGSKQVKTITMAVSSVGTRTVNGVTNFVVNYDGWIIYEDGTSDQFAYTDNTYPLVAGEGVEIKVKENDGKHFEISASGGGGGVSDVQINGTTIVSDGVANIPDASDTQAGVVSTEAQTFTGDKTLKRGDIYLVNYQSNGVALGPTATGKGLNFKPNQTTETDFTYSFYYNRNSSQGILIRPYSKIIQGYLGGSVRCTLYLDVAGAYHFSGEGGTLLSAPTTWSTGTSGSITLASAGLYEFKVTDANGQNHSFIMNWDGSTISKSTISMTSLTADVANAMIINIGASGIVSVSINDLRTADGGTDTSLTISYRKIGIA